MCLVTAIMYVSVNIDRYLDFSIFTVENTDSLTKLQLEHEFSLSEISVRSGKFSVDTMSHKSHFD
jgi:hypothetical protein